MQRGKYGVRESIEEAVKTAPVRDVGWEEVEVGVTNPRLRWLKIGRRRSSSSRPGSARAVA